MTSKDCENTTLAHARASAGRLARATRLTVLLALAGGALTSHAFAGSVRLWPSAVAIRDTIPLSDLCEFQGFDPKTERTLAELVVSNAPPPGGSRVIHLDMIRALLSASGTNMASVTLGGATQCDVTRPSNTMPTSVAAEVSGAATAGRLRNVAGIPTMESASSRPATLKQVVIDYFNDELARYGGLADIIFDHTAQQFLDLSGPTYQFRVRRRDASPLGLVQLEIEVLTGGRTVQTVPMVVQVSMIRTVLVARRSINQGATVQAQDVKRVSLSFTRLDKLGMDDVARTIGMRAKRFISAGNLIDAGMFESVPLVTRGQLVTLTSVSGAIRVVTSAKALEGGLLGETITVRAAENKRLQLDAVVVGPGAVQIGTAPPALRLASALQDGRS